MLDQIIFIAKEQEAVAKEIGLRYEVDPRLQSGQWVPEHPSSSDINVVWLNHHLSGMYK